MIYTREHLEQIADGVNKQYFPDRLVTPSALDAYDLLEAIGCDYEWKYTSPNDSIMGLTFFGDGYWYIWPRGTYSEGEIPTAELFRKGTVVINQRLLDSKKKEATGSERFVVAHEAAHWLKDKEFFESHPDSITHTCFQEDVGKTYWNTNMTELEIIERQANYLGAALLMPRDIIIESFFKAGRYKHIPNGTLEFKPYMREWVAKTAKIYGVNYNPVKYRLKDLGVICDPIEN